MEFLGSAWLRFIFPLFLVLLSANTAHAQRVPEVVFWSAGASLFAPFVAVPLKSVILRLLALDVGGSRLWSLSAIEWVLWFPVAVGFFRFSRSSSAPLIVLALFVSAAWLQRTCVPDAPWRSAFILSLPTPVLVLVLPFLAFSLAAFVESLGA
jgi:hypothetical protein